MNERPRVVITGLGVFTSLASSVPAFWEALLAGKSGISRITGFDTTDYPTQIAGEVKDFDAEKLIDPQVAKRMDRFAQFAMVAAQEAVRISGLDFDKETRERCGVIIGSGIGGLGEIEAQHIRLLERGPRRVSPLMIPKLMANAAAAQVSIVFGLRGPNSATVTACASAAHAIADAASVIRRGEAEVMVTGGAEAAISPLSLAGFCAQKALSRRNDAPEKASRPFDLGRDGFVMGEGAGVLVLETLEHAKARGARIYAEYLGAGASADAYNIVAPHEQGLGATLAMAAALKDARVNTSDVGYINAHGTSTPLGDETECVAIRQVFGDLTPKMPISATKSMTGHLLGASAGIEAVATVLTLDTGVIHPTINYETPDPRCPIDCVPNVPREVKVDIAISNSFGFGGHNATVVLKKFMG